MAFIRKLVVMFLAVVFTSLFILVLCSSDTSFQMISTQLQQGLYAYNWVSETPMPPLFKKDFKALPKWEFEDVYTKDPEYRRTSCRQSLQHTEDPDFKKSFIPNIKLYLNREDIDVKEWNRLSHFNNPFGFMEYNYTVMKEMLALIPNTPGPLLDPRPGSNGCIRCAVVATGGILNGSKMGKEIDGHDYVFRMNGAVIQGYEEDVGNRTSVYVHTAHSVTVSSYMLKKYGYSHVPNDEGIKYVLIPEGERDYQWLQGLYSGGMVSAGPYKKIRSDQVSNFVMAVAFLFVSAWKYYAGQFNETRFYVLHPDFLRYTRNRFLPSSQLNQSRWNMVRPTNGAFTLFFALHTCDEVNAYGFITADHAKYHNYYFERNNRTRVIFYANHDYKLEMMTWKRLHDSKIIRLYQRLMEVGRENVTANVSP